MYQRVKIKKTIARQLGRAIAFVLLMECGAMITAFTQIVADSGDTLCLCHE